MTQREDFARKVGSIYFLARLGGGIRQVLSDHPAHPPSERMKQLLIELDQAEKRSSD